MRVTMAPASRGRVLVAVMSATIVAAASGGAALAATESAAPDAATESAAPGAAVGLGNPTKDLCPADGSTLVFGYDTFNDKQDYVVSFDEGLQKVADELGCIEIVELVDNIDAATALANMRTFVQREVDGVILFQVVADAQEGVMNILNEAGIPAVAHAVPAPGAKYISPGDEDAGRSAAQGLADAFAERASGESPWLVLGAESIVGPVGVDRVDRVPEYLKDIGLEVPAEQVIVVDTDGTPDNAYRLTLSATQQIPEGATVMFTGINDDVVGAMARALAQNGFTDTTIGAGMGALFPSGVKLMCETPAMAGTVDFLPETMGTMIIPALIAMINGQGDEVPDVINPPTAFLDKAAANQKYPDFAPCQ
jgi:ribose transport system substrate-binding protein